VKKPKSAKNICHEHVTVNFTNRQSLRLF